MVYFVISRSEVRLPFLAPIKSRGYRIQPYRFTNLPGMEAMPEQAASVEVDKQVVIKALASIGIEVADLMATLQVSLGIEIKPLSEKDVSVRILNTQFS